MESKMLTEKIREIEMPEDMRARIIKQCYENMEEKKMSKNTKNMFKKPMVAVAAMALCLCVTGVSALAATGKLQGFFKDVTGWNGAVIGTTYEQATDEVEMEVEAVDEHLTVALTMVKPESAPYSELDIFGLESYRIEDMEGNVVAKGDRTELAEVVDGKVSVTISLENIAAGEYKLVVTELVGSAKADQPLVLSGAWECTFVKAE